MYPSNTDSMDTCFLVPVLWWGSHGAPGDPAPAKSSQQQLWKQKHINNNKNNHHPRPQFAATTPSTARGDVGSGDLGANQNQHSPSWEGPRAFVICLQTSMIHQLCYGCYCWLWEQPFLKPRSRAEINALIYHCIPVHLTFTSSICVDHFTAAWAGEGLSFSLRQP